MAAWAAASGCVAGYTGCEVNAASDGSSESGVTDGAAGGPPTDSPVDAPADVGDSSLDGDASAACGEEQAAIVAFAQANKSCSSDTDCVFAYSRSDIREQCAGGFYVNATYDKQQWKALDDAVKNCLGPDEFVCAAVPHPPQCWHGICVGNDPGAAVRDVCLATYGDSACTTCACGVCFPVCKDVQECRAIVTCALKEGCIGTAGCAPDAPTFPCKSLVDAAGGVSSWAAQAYAIVNSCMTDFQCNKTCANDAGG